MGNMDSLISLIAEQAAREVVAKKYGTELAARTPRPGDRISPSRKDRLAECASAMVRWGARNAIEDIHAGYSIHNIADGPEEVFVETSSKRIPLSKCAMLCPEEVDMISRSAHFKTWIWAETRSIPGNERAFGPHPDWDSPKRDAGLCNQLEAQTRRDLDAGKPPGSIEETPVDFTGSVCGQLVRVGFGASPIMKRLCAGDRTAAREALAARQENPDAPSHVRVVGPRHTLTWDQFSRIDDAKMKALMISTVDRFYTGLLALGEGRDLTALDGATRPQTAVRARADEDPTPKPGRDRSRKDRGVSR